jgi:hypothetical protein
MVQSLKKNDSNTEFLLLVYLKEMAEKRGFGLISLGAERRFKHIKQDRGKTPYLVYKDVFVFIIAFP